MNRDGKAIRNHQARVTSLAEAWLAALDAGMGYDAAASFDGLVRELRWWQEVTGEGGRLPEVSSAPASELYRYREERDVNRLTGSGQRVGDPVVDAWLRR